MFREAPLYVMYTTTYHSGSSLLGLTLPTEPLASRNTHNAIAGCGERETDREWEREWGTQVLYDSS